MMTSDLTDTLHAGVRVEVLKVLVDLALVHAPIAQGAAPPWHGMRASCCFGTFLSLTSDLSGLVTEHQRHECCLAQSVHRIFVTDCYLLTA